MPGDPARERRALALTGSGDFVYDWNIERDRVAVSDELGTRLGERRGALRGSIKRWLDRVHPDDRDRFRTAFGNARGGTGQRQRGRLG